MQEDDVAVLCFDRARVPTPHHAIQMPEGAGAYAKQLYAALRQADGMGVAVIMIEEPPGPNAMWRVVLDRLRRATAG